MKVHDRVAQKAVSHLRRRYLLFRTSRDGRLRRLWFVESRVVRAQDEAMRGLGGSRAGFKALATAARLEVAKRCGVASKRRGSPSNTCATKLVEKRRDTPALRQHLDDSRGGPRQDSTGHDLSREHHDKIRHQKRPDGRALGRARKAGRRG
ncbi:hypothetical protein B7463_g3108, partial [Scytalidium lignicola]